MGQAVKRFVDGCTICHTSKRPIGKVPGFLTPLAVPHVPLYRLHSDIAEGLPSVRGFSPFLVVQDGFTKFIWTYPIDEQTAQAICGCFTQLFTLFGAPKQLVTDNGPGYTSHIFTHFLNCWGVSHFTSTPRHPQGNGLSESAVKVVGTRLRCMVAQARQGQGVVMMPLHAALGLWVDLLPMATQSCNHMHHAWTGCSPFELMIGRSPRTFALQATVEVPEGTAPDSPLILQAAMLQRNEWMREAWVAKQDAMRRAYNRNRLPLAVQEGDAVWILRPPQVLGERRRYEKLLPVARGPYAVSKVVYELGTSSIKYVEVVMGYSEDGPITQAFPERE
jgi:hypothetical protein